MARPRTKLSEEEKRMLAQIALELPTVERIVVFLTKPCPTFDGELRDLADHHNFLCIRETSNRWQLTEKKPLEVVA